MWDLSFLTRNQTCIPCTRRWILNYWTIKEVPIYFIYNLRFYLLVVSKKRWLFLGRKAMINLDSILKTRDTTLLTKVHIVKAIIFPVVTYGWKARTINKVHLWHGWCQRIDAFELWCCRRLLKVLWPGRRLNQSILREINPEYSLEGLMLKLKLQYFGYLMRITDSLEKSLMLGKIEVRRRRGH